MEQWNRDRLDYLAFHHDEAAKETLSRYPDATHFFHVDSYYLNQTNSLKVLLKRYTHAILEGKPKTILGGGIWANPGLTHFAYYYDVAACPEMATMTFDSRPDNPNPVKVSSVGAVHISPVEAFQRNGFSNHGFPQKFFWNNYCRGFETFVDLHVEFWRTPDDSDILDLRI
jgi:basic membrane lipoprotein Med (substrate-binding protein (PBP1-ABC) superfamily)